MVIIEPDKTNTLEATQHALAVSLSACAKHTCPDLKATYLLILKAFCITSLLGWLFIAGPAALANHAYATHLALDTAHSEVDTRRGSELTWVGRVIESFSYTTEQRS